MMSREIRTEKTNIFLFTFDDTNAQISVKAGKKIEKLSIHDLLCLMYPGKTISVVVS
jgi:hypothetical protein